MPLMRVLVAPDSYKGSLTSVQVAGAIAAGWRSVRRDDTIDECPMSDGGRGLLDAVLAADPGWQALPVTSRDPLGRPVPGRFLRSGDRGVVELADASGLWRVAPDERDPLAASTFGTGLTLSAAAELGVRRIILGAGGSATTDGGCGLLAALGAQFLDADGRDLPPGGAALARLDRVDFADLSSLLGGLDLVVASDVRNPLLGPDGAAAVYGPQKGASPRDVEVLDAALARYADVLEGATGRRIRDVPGAGAAGGTVAGLLAIADRFASFSLRPGADEVMGLVGFTERLAAADLVLSGEGMADEQTAWGKTAQRVAEAARRAGRPCIVLAGGVTPDGEEGLAALGAAAVASIAVPMTVEEAMAAGAEPVRRAAARAARIVGIGALAGAGSGLGASRR